jgi:hypothetical protein
VTSLGGPVELVEGELVLLIPLAAGGHELVPFTRGIGRIEGEVLRIVIPHWLAEKLDISEGCRVIVDNAGGKFNIRRATPA